MNNFFKPFLTLLLKILCGCFILILVISVGLFWSGQGVEFLQVIPFTKREYVVRPKIDKMNYEEKKAILEFVKQSYKEGKETKNAFGNGLNFEQYAERLASSDNIDFYNLVDNLNETLRGSQYYDFQRKYNYNLQTQINGNNLTITSQDQIKTDFQYKIPAFKESKTKSLSGTNVEIIGLKCDLNSYKGLNIIDISYIVLNQLPKSNEFNVSCNLASLKPGNYYIKQQIENIDYMYKLSDTNYWLTTLEIK
jgi:hypothetical protein